MFNFLLRIAKLVRADSSNPQVRVGERLAKRTMVGLSVAVVAFGASVVPASMAAQAEQPGTATGRLQALELEVSATAGRIHTLALAYEQESTEAAALAQQVSTDRANAARLGSQAAATAATLRADAILSYTGGAPAAATTVAGSDDPAVRAEYLEVAAGDLSDAIDQYRTQEAELSTAESALAAELRASESAAAATADARRVALDQAASVQAQLTAYQTELQQLEAAAAAARAAALAPQGLPVNGGLVKVVRDVVSTGGGNAGGVWLQLRECESGNNYRADTGNGFYGAYQFSQSTWSNLGYPGRPDHGSPAMQDQAAQRLQARSGWGQWPACSAALGLR